MPCPGLGCWLLQMALLLFSFKYHYQIPPNPHQTSPNPHQTSPNPHQTPTEPPCYSQIWAAANSIVLVLFQIPLPNPHQTPTKPPPNPHQTPTKPPCHSQIWAQPHQTTIKPLPNPSKPPPNPHAMPMNGTRKLDKGLMGANIVPFGNTF